MSQNFKIGDIILGEVTGIQKYGIFVKLDETSQGLVHISECQHGYVTGVDKLVTIGDKIKVMVIDVDEYSHKISLSIRHLIVKNTPLFPARQKKKPRRFTPNIGFTTLENMLPEWIVQGLEMVEQDQLNLNKK